MSKAKEEIGFGQEGEVTKTPADEETRFIAFRHGADKRYGRKVQNEDLGVISGSFCLLLIVN